MRAKTLTLFAAMTVFVALEITAQTFAQKTQDQIITFDATPDARTTPTSINPSGMITGNYSDAKGLLHGFLRDRDGTITTFDAGPNGTFATSINPGGEIAGYYSDASGTHGFVRAADGTITSYSVEYRTISQSIDARGAITGYDYDGGTQGFVRAPDGTIATFYAPGATVPNATFPKSINPSGEIAGYYSDAHGTHGFVRAPDGTFTTFDAPSAGPNGTFAVSINPRGEITGYYIDASNVAHGFLRKR